MDKNVTPEELEEYFALADRMRGAVIAHTVLLERNIDLFICRYFCQTEDKVIELMELLVSERTDFFKKAETLFQILMKECLKASKNFNDEYPRIKTDFKEIAETRNDFAHKLTLTPVKSDIGKHVIVLRKFKDKTEVLSYTESDINEIIEKVKKYSVMIKDRNIPKK